MLQKKDKQLRDHGGEPGELHNIGHVTHEISLHIKFYSWEAYNLTFLHVQAKFQVKTTGLHPPLAETAVTLKGGAVLAVPWIL